MVQLDPVLQPGDFRPGEAGGHAEERDLPAQHVIQLEVRRFHDLGALRKEKEDPSSDDDLVLDVSTSQLTSLFS